MLESVLVINLCLEVISIVGEIIDRDDVYWILSLMVKKMFIFYLCFVYFVFYYLIFYIFIWLYFR